MRLVTVFEKTVTVWLGDVLLLNDLLCCLAVGCVPGTRGKPPLAWRPGGRTDGFALWRRRDPCPEASTSPSCKPRSVRLIEVVTAFEEDQQMTVFEDSHHR